MSYAKKRYLTYLAITIFTMVLPFITINGNHMLLLSFDKMQFHFLGNAFNMNELYVMPFLLMFLFIGIFATTAILGRVWCGWACPQTIFRVIYRDLIESTILDLRRIKNKQKELKLKTTKDNIKMFIALSLWAMICVVIASNFTWYFVPPEDFFSYIKDPTNHMFLIGFVLSVAGFLFYDIIFMKENFCVYICPYSRVQSSLYDDDTKQVVYNTNRGGYIYQNKEKSIFNIKEWEGNEECTTCEACVRVCPTHIDIRKGLQVECINCLECSDACSSVMGKLGKKSLIDWGSTNTILKSQKANIFSKRNLVYFASLAVCVILAFAFNSSKEDFLINVNKTTKLYDIKEDGRITNSYILTIQNTQNKDYTFVLKLENNDVFKVKRYKPFTLKAGKRAKKVLIIETDKKLHLSDKKDNALKLKLIAFAKEDPNINIVRDLSFIYPRTDLIK